MLQMIQAYSILVKKLLGPRASYFAEAADA